VTSLFTCQDPGPESNDRSVKAAQEVVEDDGCGVALRMYEQTMRMVGPGATPWQLAYG